MSSSSEPTNHMAHDALAQQMARLSLLPLWKLYASIVTREPSAEVASHAWHWSEVGSVVESVQHLIQGAAADHRVLLLQHPQLAGVATCRTMLAAVQCVLPGERTIEHHHTPSTIRVVLSANDCKTFVDGVSCSMQDGDLIVTPCGTWHNHANDSSAPAVWVDVLDIPLLKLMNGVFGAPGPAAGYPRNLATARALWSSGGLRPEVGLAQPPHTPMFRYPRSAVVPVLRQMDPPADGLRRVYYVNPLNGSAITPTLDCCAVELGAASSPRQARTTATQVCIVLQGRGRTRVGAVEHVWGARDIFTVPEWQWVTHSPESESASLMILSDAPFRRSIGQLREEASALGS